MLNHAIQLYEWVRFMHWMQSKHLDLIPSLKLKAIIFGIMFFNCLGGIDLIFSIRYSIANIYTFQ